jgi:hypothetical protein
MAEPIFMRVGEGQTVDLPDFHRATGNFLGLLQEYDSAIAQTSKGFLSWRVTSLRTSPSPVIGVTPTVRGRVRHAVDTSALVEKELISTIGTITEGKDRPQSLSDAALNKIHRLAKTAPEIGESRIFTGVEDSYKLQTVITVTTLNQINELTMPRSVSFGTVIGKLDTISVHNGFEFRVWEDDSRRPVRCFISDNQRNRAIDFLGKPVFVTGVINADRNGQPLSMQVETFDAVSEPDGLPTIEEMKGLVPDFTGGRSLKEFFEDCD